LHPLILVFLVNLVFLEDLVNPVDLLLHLLQWLLLILGFLVSLVFPEDPEGPVDQSLPLNLVDLEDLLHPLILVSLVNLVFLEDPEYLVDR
jgi:hypothetical protein